MAITTLDGYIASQKQLVSWIKTGTRTMIATIPFSVFDVAGNPGNGVLAAGNTTNGLVPTAATAGCPIINAFGGAATGYLSRVAFGSTAACRLTLFDMLFKVGAFNPTTTYNLTSQPSYTGRVPGGTDFSGTEIWIETVTAVTGNISIAVTYTNQAGTTGKTTGTVATGIAPTLGRMISIPLAAGDSGVQKIESVVTSANTGGTYNVLILRRLWSGRVFAVNTGDVHGLDKTGMPQIFNDSAIFLMVQVDGTALGVPELQLEICNG